MAYNPQQIKAVEGNTFSIIFPLRARTYTLDCKPVDEDIDFSALENVQVKVGGTSYNCTIEELGVQIVIEGDLPQGTYDMVLTADYYGAKLRAAYFEGLVIVAWNMQSDAEQYIQGSPVVMQAAFVIGGIYTDAELERLKQELREAIADTEQAKEDMEAAKEYYIKKATELDGVAKEQTLTDGIAAIRDDISHIDTTTLAKETTAEAAKQAALDAKTAAQAITGYALQGIDATATNTAIAALIGYTMQEIDGV